MVSLLTSEVVALPMRPEVCELSEDDDGECYSDHSEDVQWAPGSLQAPLFKDPTTARFCVVRQGKQTMLDDLAEERLAPPGVAYAVGGVGVVRLEVCGWQCPRNG